MVQHSATRPWIPLGTAIAVLILSHVISSIILQLFPLPQIGLLTALLRTSGWDTVCLAVVWWLILLRPHTRLSATVPIALLAIPYLLLLLLQGWRANWLRALDTFAFGMNYLSSQILGTSVIFYILARWLGWQLVRRGELPSLRRLSLAGIFTVTTLAAFVLAAQQLGKSFQIATPQSAQFTKLIEISAVANCLLALVTMGLLTWSYARRSARLVALALVFAIVFNGLLSKLIVEPLMRALIDDLPGGSVQTDWTPVYVATLASNLLFLLAIFTIEAGGYRLVQVRSREEVGTNNQHPAS